MFVLIRRQDFYTHINYRLLSQLGTRSEIGRTKNENKSPAAEKEVQKIETEIKQLLPEGGPISQVTLAISTSNLNFKIRLNGLSAFEMSTKRDQFTGNDLNFNDKILLQIVKK